MEEGGVGNVDFIGAYVSKCAIDEKRYPPSQMCRRLCAASTGGLHGEFERVELLPRLGHV